MRLNSKESEHPHKSTYRHTCLHPCMHGLTYICTMRCSNGGRRCWPYDSRSIVCWADNSLLFTRCRSGVTSVLGFVRAPDFRAEGRLWFSSYRVFNYGGFTDQSVVLPACWCKELFRHPDAPMIPYPLVCNIKSNFSPLRTARNGLQVVHPTGTLIKVWI